MRKVTALCIVGLWFVASCDDPPPPIFFVESIVDCVPSGVKTWEDGTTVTYYSAVAYYSGEDGDLAAELCYAEEYNTPCHSVHLELVNGQAVVNCGALFEMNGMVIDYPALYAVISPTR